MSNEVRPVCMRASVSIKDLAVPFLERNVGLGKKCNLAATFLKPVSQRVTARVQRTEVP